MIRDRFRYEAPDSTAAAVELLAGNGDDAAVLAGGTWLVWLMHSGHARPSVVIDLRRAGLSGVDTTDGRVTIGAATTYTTLETAAATPALLRTMASGITGGAQIRNQGTLGGSICYASPASDAPAALVALEATMHVHGADGARDVPAREFFADAFATTLGAGELLVGVSVGAAGPDERFGYVKFKVSGSSWPIVTAGCRVDGAGRIASLAVGGAAPVPVVVDVGDAQEPSDIAALAREAIAEPYADVHADGAYRRHVAGVMATRAVAAARRDDAGGDGR